ncbi:MAG: hypothetical protein CMB24_05235 [Euryarchaeota archaeon]|nr:hypothetical protein [Euryarchaeota archaeon]
MSSSYYPLWIEKILFLGLIALGVYAGIALQDHLDGASLILSWVCGLPLIVLVLTEGTGRILQAILSK